MRPEEVTARVFVIFGGACCTFLSAIVGWEYAAGWCVAMAIVSWVRWVLAR